MLPSLLLIAVDAVVAGICVVDLGCSVVDSGYGSGGVGVGVGVA